MDVISRAKALGATSALALVGPSLLGQFLLAAEKIDPDDLKLLNVAIAYERAGIKAYTDAAATKLVSAPVFAVMQQFVADHTAHLSALTAAVTQAGGQPTGDTTQLTYPNFQSQTDIVTFAYGVERGAAGAYLSTIAAFKNRNFAQLAATILGVETTHVALLAQALHKNPAYPSGFVTS
jgi:rubrerythrin